MTPAARGITFAILGATAMVAWHAVHAQIYRCVDQKGQVHYSQSKPGENDCATVKNSGPPLPPTSAGSAAPHDYSKDLERYNQEDAKAREAAQHRKAEREARCAAARQRQGLLDHYGSRIFSMDDKGERTYMTEEQYQAERTQIAQILAGCS